MNLREVAHEGATGSASALGRLPPALTIERVGQYGVIRHRCGAALRELATAMHVAAVHPVLGFKTVPHRRELFEVQGPDWAPETVIRAGLEPVAVALLQEAGHVVTFEGRPITPLPSSRPTPGHAGPADPALLDLVRSRERGLIRLGPGVDPALLVAQLHHAFPDATVAVATTRHEDVRRFGRRLKALVPRAYWSATGDDFPSEPGPLVVTTFWGLGDHGVAIHRRDFLICLDAGEGIGSTPHMPIDQAERARVFGLARIGWRPAPYDRDRAWCWFGFDALDIPAHGRVARAVEVVTGRVVGDTPAGGPGLVDLKRRGIWHHPLRNRRVARLAAALACDPAAVAAELPALATRPPVASSGVVVLVEGAEHAAEMARRLPGWGLLLGPHVAVTSTRPATADRGGAGATAPIRAVATLDGLRGVDLEGVDVLVRADGGLGVPAALEAGLTAPATGPDRGPLLVVDFDDRHHPGLRRRARARREAYLALGWPVDGRGGPASPLELFRATRPRGAR